MLIKPQKLQPGDKVATISPSWGGAGDAELRWRYDQGVKRLEEVFDIEVVPMPNSLKGTEFVDENPQARAEDLMMAFQDNSIKGIITNIGGDDSIRLLPYIDFNVIRNNPKVFMGYSDVTISHLFCYKAGLSSFYGPAIMTDFAENVEMHPYTVDMINRTLFSNEAIGTIPPAEEWTSEFLPWEEGNKHQRRTFHPNAGYEVLQGEGKVHGHLLGGCIEVLEFAKATEIWPSLEDWKGSILFFETSEVKTQPEMITYYLRNYAAQGILQKANGIIFGKPYDDMYYEEYKQEIKKVMKENSLEHLPILYNVSFGHTEPKCILPYGADAEIDCENKTFATLENGVT
ncbi:S66 family peptidase [Pontibacillus yanchengensis]|uniref:Peptidase S66 n=1 Tax=Pontibacillus yanchengensis Y32 TaxID=1385514 RepID=A0A0A2T629_9BACI|nr:S66 peptidase family protein [Pontibacillus yanchengensis]KGP71262.1 peptidase S66 [Pontibacillus yanchengensis Y32]